MNNSSALHLAAEGGHAAVVRVLVDAGASVADENGVSGILLNLMHMHMNMYVLCMHACVRSFYYSNERQTFDDVDFISKMTSIMTVCTLPSRCHSSWHHESRCVLACSLFPTGRDDSASSGRHEGPPHRARRAETQNLVQGNQQKGAEILAKF